MRIQEEALKKMVVKISNTRPEEIGCETCYEELHQFADMIQRGEDPAKVMPLVKHHLEMCGSCGEEFDAFLDALKAVDAEA